MKLFYEYTVVTSEDDESKRFTGEDIQLSDDGSVTAYFIGVGY